MPVPLRLEVFESVSEPASPTLLLPEEIEDIRLSAYERGYGAGWDDAQSRTAEAEAAHRAVIEHWAEQLSFTYHEARAVALASLRPLLEALLRDVVPQAARAATIPAAIEALLPFAQAALDAPIRVRIGLGRKALFKAAIAGIPLPPLEIVETPDLGETQIAFDRGAEQTRVDLQSVARDLHAAIETFYQIEDEESRRA